MTSTPRKPKRMLTAEQKYDLWLRMLTGQISQADAAFALGPHRPATAPTARPTLPTPDVHPQRPSSGIIDAEHLHIA